MDEPTSERWRPIEGYAGRYDVSTQGRVRSWVRGAKRPDDGGYRILSAGVSADGYRRYVLVAEDGTKRNWPEHQLVLTSFVGPRPEGMECCHNNGDPGDNRVENLRWDTTMANRIDRRLHGRDSTGVHRTDRCRRGHVHTQENTRIYFKNGHMCQECKVCRKTWEAARREQRR